MFTGLSVRAPGQKTDLRKFGTHPGYVNFIRRS